jgi:hypothetical protein
MILKKVLYPTKVNRTRGWQTILMMHPLSRIVFISLLAAQATPNTVWAQVKPVPPIDGGKIQSVTDSSVDVQTGSGVVHVAITQPLTTHKQIPSDLNVAAHVWSPPNFPHSEITAKAWGIVRAPIGKAIGRVSPSKFRDCHETATF